MFTYREILDLYNAAETAYDNGHYLHSAELYHRAMELSAACTESEEISKRYAIIMHRAEVHSLVCVEKLREALALLAPLAREEKQAVMHSCCVYGTTTDQLAIAQALPVSLRTIEKVFGHAEAYARTAGSNHWRSKTLHLRARLYLERGMFRQALAVAQEGWAIWQEGCPAFYATTHLETLFDISLALRDTEEAGKYITKWERHEKKKSRVGDATLYSMYSRLARMERHASYAVDHARRAVQAIELADWGEVRYFAGCTLVRAFLVAGEHERARDTLARLMLMRRSESGHDRYNIELLRGDYHLARARVAARLPPADDEFDEEFPAPGRLNGGHAPGHELKKARAAYQSAFGIGACIDEMLECSFRKQTVSERLERVARLEREA